DRSLSIDRKVSAMAKAGPVILSIAPLPREQIGAFLLLGLDKTATTEQAEASWAERLKQARKNQTTLPLEDINWARDVVKEPENRVRADAGSLNLDTSMLILKALADRYGEANLAASGWQPRDVEKPLAGFTLPTPVPDIQEIQASIAVPEVPRETP